jgi:vesicle coat complex subunit
MTVGKDVSQLFPDVVNCMQTDNLELKKLVYLYLMNYAKTQPEMAILAVNTFAKVKKKKMMRKKTIFFFFIFRIVMIQIH